MTAGTRRRALLDTSVVIDFRDGADFAGLESALAVVALPN